MQAGSLASAAADRLKDLARQLDNLKKHCLGKDIPLCDTLNIQSLDVKMKFETVTVSHEADRAGRNLYIIYWE